jgi:hypothetical protein
VGSGSDCAAAGAARASVTIDAIANLFTVLMRFYSWLLYVRFTFSPDLSQSACLGTETAELSAARVSREKQGSGIGDRGRGRITEDEEPDATGRRAGIRDPDP